MNSRGLFILIVSFLSFHCIIYAQNYIDDSITLVLEHTPEHEKASLIMDYAEQFFPADIDTYIKLSNLALHHALKSNNTYQSGNIYDNLGDAFLRIGVYDSALFYSHKALNQYQSNSDSLLTCKAFRRIGIVYHRLNDFDNARTYYEKSIKIAEDTQDSLMITSSKMSLALYFADVGDLETASSYLMDALRLAESIQNSEIQSDILNNISVVFGKLGNFDKSIKYQKMAIALTKEMELSEDLAYSLNNMGIIFRVMGEIDSSLYYYNQSLEIEKRMNDQKGISTSLVNIGSVYLGEKEYEVALEYFIQSLQLAEINGFEREEAASCLKIGKVFFLQEDYTKSVIYLQKCLELCGDDRFRETQKDAHDHLAKIYEKQGLYKKSLYHFRKYVLVFEALNNEKTQQHILNLEARYENTKKEKHIEALQNERAIQQVEIKNQQLYIYALAITFLLVLTVVFGLFYRFKQQRRNRENKLKEENIEIENKLLRSQMNPHFIYNSLNTIQSFISSNNKLSAMNYISKFGILTRNILENSRKAYILLSEEIETITTYIEIENIKRTNPFDYSININDDIDIESSMVPSMLAQPFIENAIKHGLREDQPDSRLEINIEHDHNTLLWTITDNGIGREKASEISAKKNIKHQSLGMQITNERLKSLSFQRKTHFYYEIIDLKDGNGLASETQVILCAPTISSF